MRQLLQIMIRKKPGRTILLRVYNKVMMYSQMRFGKEALCNKITETLKLNNSDSDQRLAVIQLWIKKANSINVNTMTFDYCVEGLQQVQPRGLLESAH